MLGNVVRKTGDRAASVLILKLVRMGMCPKICHACEVLMALGSGVMLAAKLPVSATIFFLFHGLFDYLDGALRRAGAPTGSGTILQAKASHALADKAAELLLFFGIAIGKWAPWDVVIAALGTSLVATITGFWVCETTGMPRARSLFDRTDKMLLLFGCLLIRWAVIGVYAIVVMNCVIIVQRLIEAIYKSLPESYKAGKNWPD
jgi:phosphatidylglycerophosphate synthase